MLPEPVGDATYHIPGTRERDATFGHGIDEAGIAHPYLGEASQVRVEHHIDLKPRIGQAEVDFVCIDDDPVVATSRRHRREDHLDDHPALAESSGSEEAAHVPKQQSRIEVSGPVVAARPALPPDPKALNERKQFESCLGQGIYGPLVGDTPDNDACLFEFLQAFGQESRRTRRHTTADLVEA